MTEYLNLEDLVVVADAALRHRAEIRDVGLLQAAAARPAATAFGDEAYPGLDDKAAALFHSLVTGQALVDGNKRLGWVALRLFYRLNGEDLHAPSDEAYELVVSVASGELADVPAIARRLGVWRSPLADED